MKRIIKIFLFLIIIIWILINLLPIINLSFFGIRIFRIGSGSMEPNLKVNDLIIVKSEESYNIDDIVTFKDDGHFTTHRIVEIENEKITTKGDYNNSEDPSITQEKIVGKMIYRFKILGFLRYLLSKPTSWVLIFIICVFIIIGIPVKTEKGKHMS